MNTATTYQEEFMGIRLTKTEINRLHSLKSECEAANESLEGAVGKYNDTIDAAWNTFEDCLREYSEALYTARETLDNAIEVHAMSLSEAKSFIDDLANEREEMIEDRSERWKESEAGENAQTLLDSLREFETSCEPFEPETTEAPEIESPEHIDTVSIPDTPGLIEAITEL